MSERVTKEMIEEKADRLQNTDKLTVGEWCKKLHAHNVQKGFHENPTEGGINPSGRTIWTMLGNIVCEVSEAWEEVREGTFDLNEPIRWEVDPVTNNDKPEGIGPELADILIRTMDTAEALGIDLERMVAIKHTYNQGRKTKHGGKRI